MSNLTEVNSLETTFTLKCNFNIKICKKLSLKFSKLKLTYHHTPNKFAIQARGFKRQNMTQNLFPNKCKVYDLVQGR